MPACCPAVPQDHSYQLNAVEQYASASAHAESESDASQSLYDGSRGAIIAGVINFDLLIQPLTAIQWQHKSAIGQRCSS